MFERYNNIIYKRFLRSKTIKVILSSITRIGLTVCIKDPEEAPSINYAYIEEDTKVEETTVADTITTTYPVRSDTIFIINLNTS